MGYIYLITCDNSPKVYVGQTSKSIEKRWYEHQQCGKRTKKYENDTEKIKNIQHSYLYHAMAYYGIHTFKIEVITETSNELLDDLEMRYIKDYNCQAPNGFNLTSGGKRFTHSLESIEAIKQRKRELIDQIRNEKLRGLPAKVTYRNHKTNGEQIIFNNHALCKHKTFSEKTYGTFEQAKIAAMEFIADLETNQIVYIKPKRGDNGLKGKPGFISTPKGYRVNKVHKGKTYDKRFERKDQTNEANRNAAEEYYNKLLIIISQIDHEVQRLNGDGAGNRPKI